MIAITDSPDIREPYALSRRGMPLPAARHAPARGAWLPSVARNAMAVAEAPVAVAIPRSIDDGGESPWWEEAAEWIPRSAEISGSELNDDADKSEPRSETASTAADRLPDSAMLDQRPDRVSRTTSAADSGHVVAESIELHRTRPANWNVPKASTSVASSNQSVITPLPLPHSPRSRADATVDPDHRPRRATSVNDGVDRPIEAVPTSTSTSTSTPTPALPARAQPRHEPRTTMERMHAPDPSEHLAIEARRPRPSHGHEAPAMTPRSTPLPTMGAPSAMPGSTRATPMTALADLSSRAATHAQPLQIDCVSIDIHSAPPLPVPPTTTSNATPAGNAAAGASSASGYRSPWAGYHLRRD